MRPVTLTTVGVENSPICPPDIYLNPFSVSLQAVVDGAATYTVEWTQDNIWDPAYDPDDLSSTWNSVDDMEDATADATAIFTEPVRGFRLRQTIGAAPNSVTLRIVQAGAVS